MKELPNIEYVRRSFEKRGYKLVSESFTKASQPLDIICPKEHWFTITWRDFSKKGRGCSVCSGKRVTYETSLLGLRPELSIEWHSVRNGNLTPVDVTENSYKKVWWQCKKGHEWEATVANRSRGTGCPYCSGRKVTYKDSLAAKYPNIAKEWHPIRNENVEPDSVSVSSNKKIWWQCDKGHEWVTAVAHRTKGNKGRGTKCPFCSGQKVTMETSIFQTHPRLVKEWHKEKNTDINPFEISYGSTRKVWWQCKKGHEWEASCNNRSRGRSCPYCSNKIVNKENSLATLKPELAKEWSTVLNKGLSPHEVTRGSSLKVWWSCREGHSWQAVIKKRVSGQGCPKCQNYIGTSFAQQAIYYYISKVFPDVKHRYYLKSKDGSFEIDIYIPTLKLGIEYDGHFHEDEVQVARDIQKNEVLGSSLLRVRKKGLPNISSGNSITIEHDDSNYYPSLAKCILEVFHYLKQDFKFTDCTLNAIEDITIDLSRDRIQIYELYLLNRKNYDIADVYPHLQLEWHSEKNGKLSLANFSKASNCKLWWQCEKGHEWEATINQRTSGKGSGCPYCSGRRTISERCLNIVNPALAQEWHPTKNGELNPTEVSAASNKRVWWLCEKGHEWEAKIGNRHLLERGCPYCSGNKATSENCLSKINRKLAAQWHSTKNGELKPSDVKPNSGKKVWWLCGKGHEWEAIIQSRNRGNGCPYCSGRKATSKTCLRALNPVLAEEWHPIKNGEVTPEQVTAASHKKVWWRCDKGHEWEATVDKRHLMGRGCPYCSGNKITSENCLSKINRELAAQWHPTRNGELKSSDVKPNSGKKVWWLCGKGHEWEAMIQNRNRGRGCPYCRFSKG
ncbi:zinc-ribbon domain-containing protein [Peribacillus frigoritolerans]|uniref:zinc-ribbon domain-containing protein n=1 Tax=Peribacillus frigoritolerans TaxID=450367 RepID=UPI002E22EC60|nr:zinc-ribbon domain-containing protein [Peribacillus frigoritolerans]MED3848860.1 zinc-ribbon domain-containing protein [Peribacillus frigoritolerans]